MFQWLYCFVLLAYWGPHHLDFQSGGIALSTLDPGLPPNNDRTWQLAQQKQAYNLHCKGEDFALGAQVWVYSPEREKGFSLKLASHWAALTFIFLGLGLKNLS